MRSLIIFGLLALCQIAAAKFGPKWNELEGYTFDNYVSDYGLSYTRGSSEWKTRENNFNTRLDSIRAHNADTTKSWKRGVNQFADWSEEEFHEYNRAKFKPNTKPIRATQARSASDLPKTVDYRTANPPVLTAIKNQAACGDCWSHAATEEVESFFAIKFGQLPVLSQQQITSCDVANYGCGGGYYTDAWDYVQGSSGLNEEWVYPFTDFFCNPPLSQSCTSPCRNISKLFTKQFKWWPKANVSGYTNVQPNDATALMEALALEGPQALLVGSDQWSDYESGILHNNYSTEATNVTWQSINHAVQLVGYGYDFDLNENYWVVRNSWGTNYGENGYIRLSRSERSNNACGSATSWGKVCGTSGLLYAPAYPHVTELKKQNGFYF